MKNGELDQRDVIAGIKHLGCADLREVPRAGLAVMVCDGVPRMAIDQIQSQFQITLLGTNHSIRADDGKLIPTLTKLESKPLAIVGLHGVWSATSMLNSIACEWLDDGNLIALLGQSVSLIASARTIRLRRICGCNTVEDELRQVGATWKKDLKVVRHKNLVTGCHDLSAFTQEVNRAVRLRLIADDVYKSEWFDDRSRRVVVTKSRSDRDVYDVQNLVVEKLARDRKLLVDPEARLTKSFLDRCMRNAHVDLINKRQRQEQPLMDHDGAKLVVQSKNWSEEECRIFRDFFEDLPTIEHDVLDALYNDPKSTVVDLAATIGVSERTIRRRRERGVEMLRQKLAEHGITI